MIKFGFWPANINPNLGYRPKWKALTHVAYLYWDVAADGTISGKEADAEANNATIQAETVANGVKYLVGCGSGVQADIDSMLANYRSQFASNIVSLITETGAEGIILDFETPSVTNSVTGTSNTPLFQAMMQAVYTAVKTYNSSYSVMLCTPVEMEGFDFYQNSALANYCDGFFCMGYDYYWNGPAGANCPLYESVTRLGMRKSIAEHISTYGAAKTIFGLPLYGYRYTTNSPFPGAASTLAEQLFLSEIDVSAYERIWDDASKTPYFYYLSDGSGTNSQTVLNSCDALGATTYDYNVTRTVDTSDKQVGTGSLKCVATATGNVYMLIRNSPALDISSKTYVCHYVKGPVGKLMYLRLFTSSDDDYVTFPFYASGDWQQIQFPFGDATATGTFNPASVLDIRIDLADAAVGDTFWVDQITGDTYLPTYKQVWYDDVQSLTAKYQYIQDQELGGVGFWALGQEGAGSDLLDIFLDTIVLPSTEVRFLKADIVLDGTDQLVVLPLMGINREIFTGTIEDLYVNFILNNGSDVELTTTCNFSDTAGGHKLIIPSENITGAGKYSICVAGSNIQTTIIDGLIVLPESTFATAAAISALNNISQAQVLSQVTAGLTSFGVATAASISTILPMIKKCLVMEIGDYTLPEGAGAGTYSISLTGVGTATFTVDSDGNRTLSNITLV